MKASKCLDDLRWSTKHLCLSQLPPEDSSPQQPFGIIIMFAGYDHSRKCIVEKESDSVSVEHISGTALLDNHAVNLVSSFLMALLTPRIALLVWARLLAP